MPAGAVTERAFWKAIKTRSFDRIYYLYGDDEYLKLQAARELVASAVDPATRDFNLDIHEAADVDANGLASLLATPPLMAERRVIVLRDVAALKRDARAALDGYLRAPAADTVLVLIASGGERARPDRELQAVGTVVVFEPLASDRVPRWIAHHAATELHVSLTPDAVALLHRAVGNDVAALAVELDKLVSYTAGGDRGADIDEAAVSAVVGVRRGETLGDLLDRVARRDAAGALDLLSNVLEQPKTSAVSVVMALTTQTLALAWGRALRDRGSVANFYDFLRGSPSSFTGRPWGDAVAAWAAALEMWDAASLEAALEALLTADIALKETRVSSDEEVLATLILTLCSDGLGALGLASWRSVPAAV